jgi:hypothetical protein
MHNFRSLRRLSPQWFLWVMHLFVYLLMVGFLMSGVLPISRGITAIVAMIWFGLWVIHALVLGIQDARELAVYRSHEPFVGNEKPKRGQVAVGDDGELVYHSSDLPSEKPKYKRTGQ